MLTHKQPFKFRKTALQIGNFMPAFDGTLVITAMMTLGKETLMHIGKDGRMLFKYEMNDLIHSLVMPA